MIGGAEKYMAVCRRCFHSPKATIPASPRLPLKRLLASNEKNNLTDINSGDNLPKKALFEEGEGGQKDKVENEIKENGGIPASA